MVVDLLACSWIFVAIIGLGISLYAIQDAAVDYDDAEKWTHQQTRLITAAANVRRERFRAVLQLALVVGGIAALNGPRPVGDLEGVRVLLSVVLMLAAVISSIDSVFDRRARHKILALLREQERLDKQAAKAAR